MTNTDTLGVFDPVPALVDRLRSGADAMPAAEQVVISASEAADAGPRQLSSALGQLAKVTRRLESHGEVHPDVLRLLLQTTADLNGRRRAIAVAEQQHADDASRAPVRQRVLEVLTEPLRPRDVAERLELHPSKAARAIAELIEAGAVQEVERADPDGRARFYEAVAAPLENAAVRASQFTEAVEALMMFGKSSAQLAFETQYAAWEAQLTELVSQLQSLRVQLMPEHEGGSPPSAELVSQLLNDDLVEAIRFVEQDGKGEWTVRKGGAGRVVKRATTQAAAIERAQEIVSRQGGGLVVVEVDVPRRAAVPTGEGRGGGEGSLSATPARPTERSKTMDPAAKRQRRLEAHKKARKASKTKAAAAKKKKLQATKAFETVDQRSPA
jgi:hypothetical protein